MSDYPPLLYLVRIAQARRATAQNVAPQVPPSPPNHPPPKSPVASQSSVREEKAKLPSSPSYITAPGACGRACGPYCASSYSTCYFFLLLYHFLLIRHALRLPLRQMLAGSPAMQFWFSPSLPLSLSLSFLKWPVGLDQVRPGQTRRRQWREDPRPCPEGGSNYITVLAVDGLSSKVCLPDCRAPPPPANWDWEACVAQWNPEREPGRWLANRSRVLREGLSG